MRRRQLELIAALAEGRLEDESEARALIESSPEARAEFERQRAAFEALSALGSAGLTQSERALLHREVWTGLTAGAGVAATPRYLRWAPVAAALLLVVGAAGVLVPRMMGAGQDAAFEEVGESLGESTTTAGDGSEEARPLSSSTSEAAAGAPVDLDDSSFYEEQAARVREGDRAFTTMSQDEARSNDRCLVEAGLVSYLALGTVTGPEEMVTLIAVPEGADLETATVAFVDTESCTVVHLDR